MPNAQLRKQLRQQRRCLTPKQQYQHQQAALIQLLRSGLLRKHNRIAIYLNNDGELATDQIIKTLFQMRKQLFLPALSPGKKNKLGFLAFNEKTRLINNRFNIAEPALINKQVPASSISLILLPLVGFDESGNRLGMGGGFYDRTLSHCKIQRQSNIPLLVGLAHELQKVNSINKQSWDIPLDGLITEQKIRKFTKAFF